MDRVLLIIDDIQYSRHVEMTFRKVGFDVESINNEFKLSETLLTFNPDYIVCKGNSNRLSTLNVAKKLKESASKSPIKVILILPEEFNISSDELIKLKMDMLLFDPISTLKLAMSLFSLVGGNLEAIKDKILKLAITDSQFRNFEQQILRSAGVTLDSEIQFISDLQQFASPLPAKVASALVAEGKGKLAIDLGVAPAPHTLAGDKFNQELSELNNTMGARIESYNQAIGKVDQNLKVGLKKRQTRTVANKLHKDLIDEKKTDKKLEDEIDADRRLFTKALFRK